MTTSQAYMRNNPTRVDDKSSNLMSLTGMRIKVSQDNPHLFTNDFGEQINVQLPP